MEKGNIIVTGIGGNVGQGVLRILRSTYPQLQLYGTDISAFTVANYLCDNTYQVPYAYESSYVSTLNKIVEQEKIDLIIPTTDFEVYYLSQNLDKINATICVNAPEITEMYLDKYKTFLGHSKLNIPFAQSWEVNEYKGDLKNIIAKPKKGRGSRGILINPENINHLSEDYLIQNLYKGTEITTAVYVTKDGRMHGHVTMERQLHNGTTIEAKIVHTYDELIAPFLENLLSKVPLRGSFNVQSIISDKEIKPFEVNCRISGTNSIRHCLGFKDVVYTVQEYLWNKEPEKIELKKGMATRILVDTIYEGVENPAKIDVNTKNYQF